MLPAEQSALAVTKIYGGRVLATRRVVTTRVELAIDLGNSHAATGRTARCGGRELICEAGLKVVSHAVGSVLDLQLSVVALR